MFSFSFFQWNGNRYMIPLKIEIVIVFISMFDNNEKYIDNNTHNNILEFLILLLNNKTKKIIYNQ